MSNESPIVIKLLYIFFPCFKYPTTINALILSIITKINNTKSTTSGHEQQTANINNISLRSDDIFKMNRISTSSIETLFNCSTLIFSFLLNFVRFFFTLSSCESTSVSTSVCVCSK